MTGPAVYFLFGLSLLLAIVLPQATRRIALSPPMVLVAVGMAMGLLPLAGDVSMEPQDHRDLVTHVTEFTILVALMGVGLAIDRTLDLRSWRSITTWSPVWRLSMASKSANCPMSTAPSSRSPLITLAPPPRRWTAN